MTPHRRKLFTWLCATRRFRLIRRRSEALLALRNARLSTPVRLRAYRQDADEESHAASVSRILPTCASIRKWPASSTQTGLAFSRVLSQYSACAGGATVSCLP